MKLLTIILSLVWLASPALQSSVPVEKEPRHHLKFENQRTRVFDVVIPPGDETLFHTHSNDYVFVMIGDATLKAEVMGSSPSDLIVKNGEVRYTKATLTHRVKNVGNADFRNITIEVLGSAAGAGAQLPALSGHTLVLENDRVRVERVILEPGQSTGVHTHTLAGLGVSVSGGMIEIETGGQKQTSNLKPGEFRWRDGAVTHSLKNVGKTRFEAVDIEWK
jgi:quercetin dioxygenase-like cupin family protein